MKSAHRIGGKELVNIIQMSPSSTYKPEDMCASLRSERRDEDFRLTHKEPISIRIDEVGPQQAQAVLLPEQKVN